MGGQRAIPWTPFNFLATPPEEAALEACRAVVLPVPYDSTTSFKAGARDGPRAIIEASRQLEDYDLELEADISQVGIHTAPWLEPHLGGPAQMVERVAEAVLSFAVQGKLVVALGGEHSIAVGAVKAYRAVYPDLSVLYLDAHADMRDSYMGTPYSHACAARRLSEMCPIVLAGVRSVSAEEREHIVRSGVPTFWCTDASPLPSPEQVVRRLSANVYVSIDLDVLDPSVMAAVGTPEPGGARWEELLTLLRGVARERRVVGFDLVELAPEEGPAACAYLAAKLAYKLLGYALLE
ncbi:MAG: agmatinase [Chloroflexota bacterium]|nr:agmatinase [Chloroflexota bacterium]